MRKRKVWKYYCDFCKKTNCSASSIKKHESRCTLNPDRHCGFCEILENGQPDKMKEAMSLLPNYEDFACKEDSEFQYYDSDKMAATVEKVMEEIRELLNNCPACIMSALRRKSIPVPLITSFHFKTECDLAWAEFNANQLNY